MPQLAAHLRTFRPGADTALARLPGSDAHRELFHMLRDPPRFFHERFLAHGHVFKTRFVFPVVLMVGAEANRTIHITERHRFSFGQGYKQTAVDRVFENSIMVMDGHDHRTARDLLSPAVGRLAVRESALSVAAIWGDTLEEAGSTRDADCYRLAERGTFAVAANTLTGLGLGEETDAYRPHFHKLMNGILAPTKLRVPFGKLDRALRARETMRGMLRPKVEAARTSEPVGLVGQFAHHKNEDGSSIPTDAIIDHLFLLFWAGYDTTASMGSWIIHMLAHRLDWQERIRAEFASAVGDDVGAIENSRDLLQVGWFLREIERLYPSALFFPRIALEDIEFRGHVIPEGTPTFYSPYLSHRDPETFEEPNAFDPERWSVERGERRAKAHHLVGFGGGPRLCLGKAFALMQLKVMIHQLLTRYRVEPDPLSRPKVMGVPVHHPVGSGVVLRPLN